MDNPFFTQVYLFCVELMVDLVNILIFFPLANVEFKVELGYQDCGWGWGGGGALVESLETITMYYAGFNSIIIEAYCQQHKGNC